jgi:hypothetical protein
MDKTLKNSCGKRGCKVISLPKCNFVAIPTELGCDENKSFEKLRKVA